MSGWSDVCASPAPAPLPQAKPRCGAVVPTVTDDRHVRPVPSPYVCLRDPHDGDPIHNDPRGITGAWWTVDEKAVKVVFAHSLEEAHRYLLPDEPTPAEERAYRNGLEAAFVAARDAVHNAHRARRPAEVGDIVRAAATYGIDVAPPAIGPTATPPATRPHCGCPVDGYLPTCHRGDHRQNAAEGLTDS